MFLSGVTVVYDTRSSNSSKKIAIIIVIVSRECVLGCLEWSTCNARRDFK